MQAVPLPLLGLPGYLEQLEKVSIVASPGPLPLKAKLAFLKSWAPWQTCDSPGRRYSHQYSTIIQPPVPEDAGIILSQVKHMHLRSTSDKGRGRVTDWDSRLPSALHFETPYARFEEEGT